MFALLDAAVQQGTAGLAEDQYLGFVGIPKPPVCVYVVLIMFSFLLKLKV